MPCAPPLVVAKLTASTDRDGKPRFTKWTPQVDQFRAESYGSSSPVKSAAGNCAA
jgi:hypothetical protein